MGIRVNKKVGWGLTDVQAEKYTITDPRINVDSPLLGWDTELEEYMNFAKTVKDDLWLHAEIAQIDHEKVDIDPHDACTYQPEYGLNNVLLLQPLWLTDNWSRHDDTIDWLEETYFPQHASEQECWVKELPSGIFPYSSLYVDRIEGKMIKNCNTWRTALYFESRDDKDEDTRAVVLEAFSKELGYESHKQAKDRIIPQVPDEIKCLVKFGDLFTSDDVILQLRPLLYCYWA